MNTLKDVKAKVRSLVGDPMADFTTDAYLIPLINQIYSDQTTTLMADTGSSFDEEVRDVPNVPIGTTNFANWQAAEMKNDDGTNSTSPLYGLVNPILVEWKTKGQPDECYCEGGRVAKLPYVMNASGPGTMPSPFYPFKILWEWRAFVIYVTPLTYPADFRVRGEYSPPPLTKDTDILQVHPRMAEATTYGTAALIGAERNNASYATNYAAQAERVLDNISNMLVRAEQGVITRIGRYGNRGGWGSNNGAGGGW